MLDELLKCVTDTIELYYVGKEIEKAYKGGQITEIEFRVLKYRYLQRKKHLLYPI